MYKYLHKQICIVYNPSGTHIYHTLYIKSTDTFSFSYLKWDAGYLVTSYWCYILLQVVITHNNYKCK